MWYESLLSSNNSSADILNYITAISSKNLSFCLYVAWQIRVLKPINSDTNPRDPLVTRAHQGFMQEAETPGGGVLNQYATTINSTLFHCINVFDVAFSHIKTWPSLISKCSLPIFHTQVWVIENCPPPMVE